MLITVLVSLVQGKSRKYVLELVAGPFYPFVYKLVCLIVCVCVYM